MRHGKSNIQIELLRSGRVVSTITGAFGQSMRETRLTALLGYLIAIEPQPFLKLFNFPGEPQSVSLETRHDDGRSDILIETSRGKGIIEAKVDATDPISQASRYGSNWTALLTHHVPNRNSLKRNTKYVTWQTLADALQLLARSKSPRVKLLSSDLLAYLQEHRMAKQKESVEIYAREINGTATLNLFLKANVYGCNYKAGSRLTEALYFAPCFGNSLSKEHAGVAVGISYVARILSFGQVHAWADFQDYLRKERGRVWWNQNQQLLKDLRREWKWPTHRSLLLLDTPRLAFNPPIRKGSLQKGRGFLSKHFYSFDDLFVAWGQ